METLKGCPFCGSAPVFVPSPLRAEDPTDEGGTFICSDPTCRASCDYPTRELAAKMWNRRRPPALEGDAPSGEAIDAAVTVQPRGANAHCVLSVGVQSFNIGPEQEDEDGVTAMEHAEFVARMLRLALRNLALSRRPTGDAPSVEECRDEFLSACAAPFVNETDGEMHDDVLDGIEAVRALCLSRRPSPSGDIEAIVRDTVGHVLAETANDVRKPPCDAEIEEWSNAIRAALAREGEGK